MYTSSLTLHSWDVVIFGSILEETSILEELVREIK